MTIYAEGIAAVRAAYERALATGRRNMNAMSLATVNADGAPSVRTVLLKAVDERGVVFFTDSRSSKGQDLQAQPRASVCIYWEAIEEQVRVDGQIERLDAHSVQADFLARPRAGQVLICASTQSAPLTAMDHLKSDAATFDAEHPGDIPVPLHWAGYRLLPSYIETWKGSRDRFHQRVAYTKEDGAWIKRLLQP
jgi:pyridoxamine 5'-phosphate oxidase